MNNKSHKYKVGDFVRTTFDSSCVSIIGRTFFIDEVPYYAICSMKEEHLCSEKYLKPVSIDPTIEYKVGDHVRVTWNNPFTGIISAIDTSNVSPLYWISVDGKQVGAWKSEWLELIKKDPTTDS